MLNAALGVVERKRSGAQSSVYPVPAAAPTSSRSPLENISRPSPAVAASGLANLGAESGWHLYPENVDRSNVGTRRSYRSREPNREEATASQPQDPPRPRPQSTPIPNLESLLRETRSGAAGDGGGLGLAAEEKGSDHFRRGLRDIARYEERLRGLGDEDRESERRRGLLAGIGRDGGVIAPVPISAPVPASGSATGARGDRDDVYAYWRSDRNRQGLSSKFGGSVAPLRLSAAYSGGKRGAADAGGSRASLWGLGPRAVTREDLTRLDEEIANLGKTVEQV